MRESSTVVTRRTPLLERMPDMTGRVPVCPADLRLLSILHRVDCPSASLLFLRAAQALDSGARTMAGVYFDLAAEKLGIDHQTEPSTAPTYV